MLQSLDFFAAALPHTRTFFFHLQFVLLLYTHVNPSACHAQAGLQANEYAKADHQIFREQNHVMAGNSHMVSHMVVSQLSASRC